PDAVEVGKNPTIPVDTDKDGISDYIDLDSDNDSIPDVVEVGKNPAIPVDTDKDGISDYIDLDSDNDSIPDVVEAGKNPVIPVDTDNDGVPDYKDIDSDNDGIKDQVDDCRIIVNPPKPVILQENITLKVNSGFVFQWKMNGIDLLNGSLNTIKVTQSGTYTVQIKDQNGCLSPISDSILISITESKDEYQTIIFPNPFHQEFILKYDSSKGVLSQIEIFNQIGIKILKIDSYQSGKTIDMINFPSGEYILKTNFENGESMTFKIIKVE
ncbi:MAG: T9SS type A sorting domain-containing protein, partial [Aquirufa sp.]